VKCAIILTIPYATNYESSSNIGKYPVENDVFFNFNNSFSKIGFKLIFGTFEKNDNDLVLSYDKTIKSTVEYIQQHLPEEIVVFTVINQDPTTCINSREQLRIAKKIKELFKVKILTFIPDCHHRLGHLLNIVEAINEVSDSILYMQKSAPSILKGIFNRGDLCDKMNYILSVPTLYYPDYFDIHEKRLYDICCNGSMGGKKVRIEALQKILDIPNIKIYFSNGGHEKEYLNPTRKMEDLYKIYMGSRFSLCTAAAPAWNVAAFDELKIMQPPIFPGRVAESIACGCLPIYVKERFEEFPLPRVSDFIPCIETDLEHLAQFTQKALASLNSDDIEPMLKSYHLKHLSPDAILGPVLYPPP